MLWKFSRARFESFHALLKFSKYTNEQKNSETACSLLKFNAVNLGMSTKWEMFPVFEPLSFHDR